MSAFRAGCVTVKPDQAQIRKFLRDRLCNSLSTAAKMLEVGRATGRAVLRQQTGVVAVMAPQQGCRITMHVVIRQRDIAVRTGDDVPTAPTRNKGAVSPTMNKQNTLLLALFHCQQCRSQRSTKNGMVPLMQFLPHIDNINRWQGAIVDTGGKGEE